jgi:hypothetical protein
VADGPANDRRVHRAPRRLKRLRAKQPSRAGLGASEFFGHAQGVLDATGLEAAVRRVHREPDPVGLDANVDRDPFEGKFARACRVTRARVAYLVE